MISSVLFSLRREREFLGLLRAACDLKGADAPCQAVISEIIQSLELRIEGETSFRLAFPVLVSLANFGRRAMPSIFERINNRPCNQESSCIRDLLSPILALDKNAEIVTFRAAIQVAQEKLFVVNESLRQIGIQKMIAIFKPPIEECTFHESVVKFWVARKIVSCLKEKQELRARIILTLDVDVVNWITKEDVQMMKQEAQVVEMCLILFF